MLSYCRAIVCGAGPTVGQHQVYVSCSLLIQMTRLQLVMGHIWGTFCPEIWIKGQGKMTWSRGPIKYFELTLKWCWPTVFDADPTSFHHCLNVLCLPGHVCVWRGGGGVTTLHTSCSLHRTRSILHQCLILLIFHFQCDLNTKNLFKCFPVHMFPIFVCHLYRRLGAKGSYLPLWRVSDRIL